MENRQNYYINISAPNLVNVCIDHSENGEISGRLYHCYDKNCQSFSNIMQLFSIMEKFFDMIAFPQASTETRYFLMPQKRQETREERMAKHKPAKIVEQKEIIQHTGKKGTFIISVRYRQNSDWQGDMVWIEQERMQQFISTLEFIRLLDHALKYTE